MPPCGTRMSATGPAVDPATGALDDDRSTPAASASGRIFMETIIPAAVRPGRGPPTCGSGERASVMVLRPDERQQVCVDVILVHCAHAVREPGIHLQRRAFDQLRRQP